MQAGLLLLSALFVLFPCPAIPSASPQLKFSFYMTYADMRWVDEAALWTAQSMMQNITTVPLPPQPERAYTGPRSILCTPDFEYIGYNVSDIAHGEIVVFVFTQQNSRIKNCTEDSIAYASWCAWELPDYMPLVAFLNVCPRIDMVNTQLTASERNTLYEYGVRSYTHELIHIMGMISPVVDRFFQSSEPMRGWQGNFITLPGVVQWARAHYACERIYGVPMHGAHWDPMFVGEREIMTRCLSENSTITPATLSFLDNIGPYDILTTETRHWTKYIQQLPYGMFQGCEFSHENYCGLSLTSCVSASRCERNCIGSDEPIVTPVITCITDRGEGGEEIMGPTNQVTQSQGFEFEDDINITRLYQDAEVQPLVVGTAAALGASTTARGSALLSLLIIAHAVTLHL